MNQYILLLSFFCLFLNLSSQTQLFREFAGVTGQNLQAEASQWTLSDPSGTQYEIGVDCFPDTAIVKPDSLPTGTTLKKTFDGLEGHNVLRFYVQIYYLGTLTSQTVMVKFDGVSIEMSQVVPSSIPLPPSFPSQQCPLPTSNVNHIYYGDVPHNASSVTVEFTSDLNGADTEISWALRNFSLVTDMSDTISSGEIYVIRSFSFLTYTVPTAPCSSNQYFDGANCQSCDSPCAQCYGPGSDHCFTFLPTSPENSLCPQGQTYLTSGCTNCAVENCDYCNEDVNQCDTCLNTCGFCDTSTGSPQCLQCTVVSNLVLYQGACIDSCPQGMYADPDNICQDCQPGCLDCTDSDQCSQCASGTTNTGGICICNDPGKYFESDSGGCTGNCLLGCEQCIVGEECRICASGMTVQSDGDCRCDNDGFYYQDSTGSCIGQCFDYCDYCHDATSCISCSGDRTPQDGMCKCVSPRILIGTSCECPSFMDSNCEYITDVGFTVQSTISPLFDEVLILHTNPINSLASTSYQWTISCPFENQDAQDQFQSYVSSQNANVLLIPSGFLENNLLCTVQVSDSTGMISQGPSFKTVSPALPQIHIVGGPFQMFNPGKPNFILIQVESSIGNPLSASDLTITWTQTSGDTLDISSMFTSSDPFKLTVPKCILSKGKLYSFRLSVQLIVNPGSQTSQEITIGAYAPKFQAQVVTSENNYHLLSESLMLGSQISLQEDTECGQTDSLTDLLDLSTAMYTWECRAIDLQLPASSRRLGELFDITDDSDVYIPPDPLQLFYQSTSSSTLTVPSSYFTNYPGYQFIFYLNVTIQSKVIESSVTSFQLQRLTLQILTSKTSLHLVLSKPFTIPSFTCFSENGCQAYSADFQTKFIGSSFDPQYSYNWVLNTLVPSQYDTFLTAMQYGFSDQTIVPRILYTISDGTNIASAFMTLPWNNPPQDGNLGLYPTEGEAYTTKFFLYAYGWTDTDLPLSYQFFTSSDGWTIQTRLLKTFNPYGFTPVISPVSAFSYPYVGVVIQDSLKATTKSLALVSLSGGAQSFCEAVDKSSQALTQSMISDSLLYRFQLISVILENLQEWESSAFDSTCVNVDSEFKFTAVTEMKEIVQSHGSLPEFKPLVLQNLVFSAYPEANQDQNFKLYTSIVDSFYQLNSSVLPADEYTSMLTFIDYLIWYMKKPGTSIEDPNEIFTYINMVLRSTLSNKTLPTDTGILYQGTFYTYFTIKTTYCKVLQGLTDVTNGLEDSMQANVTLRSGQQIPPEKCDDQINMIYLAFKSNYTLETQGFVKNLIYFDLIDSNTGKSLLDIFTFLLLSTILTCPDPSTGISCNPTGDGTQIYGIFDLKDQINKIFAKSNIAQIQNISVLAHFEFWKSVAFWTVIAFSVWFLLSFYWLWVKHPTYCALTSKKNTISKAPLLKKIHLFFWVIHPLVGIYVYNDIKTSKPVKLAIYYQRLVIVMVFSTIFSSLDKGEVTYNFNGWVFKGYILLFNTVTVTPVNAVLSRIFEWTFKIDNSKKITSKIKLFGGTFFYLALLVACFLVIFIIEAQEDFSQNKTWAFNFLIAWIQDLSLSPALSALNKYLLIRFSITERVAKKIKSQKIKTLILSDDVKSIYGRIFSSTTTLPTILTAKNSVKDDGLSPRSALMSPVSTTRKFLKFTTIDLQSPEMTKNNTHFDFRTRIASENEIGSVDLVPMENLISKRFQTLFPEAKAETVRPTSPTKQNFEKMQATNIYSKNSITNFPTLHTTIKSSVLKQSKPFNTIEFNAKEPVEMTLDDIFQFADQPDEGEEIPQASQLKLWKNNSKTTESPLQDKKKHTPVPSYLPSVELSLEQRLSEKAHAAIKKKSVFKQGGATPKPFQLMDLSSMNQFKEPSAIHPDEFSSFDGHPEETFVSQLKLLKNNSKATSSPDREKRKDLIKSAPKITIADLSSGDLPSVPKKMAPKFKFNEATSNKAVPSMEVGSVLKLKEPAGFQPDEFSSFDENTEEAPVSLPKFKTKGSIKKKMENQK